MFCKKCGTQLPESTTTCANCGDATASDFQAVAAEKIKHTSKDALGALRSLASDPVGGMSPAFEGLGQARALGVGVAFGIVFALCVLFARVMLDRPRGFKEFLMTLILAIIPFISLLGASIAAKNIFQGKGELGHNSFIAGASLLPIGCAILLAPMLSLGNFEIIAVLMLFALCITVLMLFTGLTRICMLSDRAATIAVPLILVVSAWISKIIYTAI